jgi:hypothetical protein
MHTIDQHKQSQLSTHESLSLRCYRVLLRLYPEEFRQEFGEQLVQTFRDCYRANCRDQQRLGVLRLWLQIIPDIAQSASAEHFRNGEEHGFMKNWQRQVAAILGCVAIIAFLLFLLTYGRRHEVAGILAFGHVLDAVITAGILGNLIVFILAKLTRFDLLKTALWCFLIVNLVLFGTALLIGRAVDPHFQLGMVLVGYVVSFVFWLSLYWLWSRIPFQPQTN